MPINPKSFQSWYCDHIHTNGSICQFYFSQRAKGSQQLPQSRAVAKDSLVHGLWGKYSLRSSSLNPLNRNFASQSSEWRMLILICTGKKTAGDEPSWSPREREPCMSLVFYNERCENVINMYLMDLSRWLSGDRQMQIDFFWCLWQVENVKTKQKSSFQTYKSIEHYLKTESENKTKQKQFLGKSNQINYNKDRLRNLCPKNFSSSLFLLFLDLSSLFLWRSWSVCFTRKCITENISSNI